MQANRQAKRADYNGAIDSRLTEEFTKVGVIFEQANITNLAFSESFNAAIESKVTAEQQALKAQNDLKRIQFEAQQTVETAKATAEAQRISSAALAAQGGEDYVNLKWIEKWNGQLPQQFIPGQALPFLNLR